MLQIRLLIVAFALLGALAASLGFMAKASANDLSRLIGTQDTWTARVDSQGRPITPELVRDRLTVISFVSAGCSILCVTRTMDLDRLARNLPEGLRGRVLFLAIDTDPAADDAPRLNAFANDLLGPEAPLRVLPSNAEAVKAVVEGLHYPPASLPEPPPTVLLFDRRGQVAMSYGGAPFDAPRLARDLAVLDTFTHGLGHSQAPVELTR